jgi:DNA-binding Lrp family transcriptional regulator
MRKLEKLDILQAYRANIDFSKLGYHLYKVNIDLIDYNQRGRIINYIKNNPHLAMIDKSIGYYDLEIDLYLKNLDHLHKIMDDLTIKFPNDIRNYSYVHDPILYKLRYIPEE